MAFLKLWKCRWHLQFGDSHEQRRGSIGGVGGLAVPSGHRGQPSSTCTSALLQSRSQPLWSPVPHLLSYRRWPRRFQCHNRCFWRHHRSASMLRGGRFPSFSSLRTPRQLAKESPCHHSNASMFVFSLFFYSNKFLLVSSETVFHS